MKRRSTPAEKKVRLRVGAVQMISEPLDVEANVCKALRFCDRAAKRGVQMLCFPECAANGFDWAAGRRGNRVPPERVPAEPVPGPMVERFAAKARETDMYIIMGMVERPRRSKRIYNTAFLVGPREGYIGRYRKVFSEGIFADGREAPVFDTRYGKIGIFICADMRSPEIAALLVLKGARILFQPTNYFHADGVDVRRRYMGKVAAQRSRSMENGVPLVIANAGRREYVNNSRILAPESQGPDPALARATRREQLLVADISFRPVVCVPRERARRAPWLFRELADAMRKAAR